MKFFLTITITALFLALQSCSVDTKTVYYKDAATAMQSDITLDQAAASMMRMAPGNAALPDLQGLSDEWKSLYDLQKNNKITMNADSAQVLKKLFLKLNKAGGQASGISIKYDKLMPREVAELFAGNKKLSQIPLQNIAKWDGKTLIIDTDKFAAGGHLADVLQSGPAPGRAPATKQDSLAGYGREMAQGAIGMMKMFNMAYSNTLRFQKPIKSIVGKSSFVRQIDPNTVKITVNSRDLFDDDLKNKMGDRLIIITTE